jgi:hypothetical protein
MGVTIHFEGNSRGLSSIAQIVAAARDFAQIHGWRVQALDQSDTTLKRVQDEEDRIYRGPVTGVALFPHDWCDPVRLEFDSDGYIQEFTKTQFAGVDTHTEIVQLLRRLEPLFEKFLVDDEGEFWDGGDRNLLALHFANTNNAIAEYRREHRGATGPVRLEDGRIVDIMS